MCVKPHTVTTGKHSMVQFFSAVLSTLAIALLVGGSYFLRPTIQVRSAEAAEASPSTEKIICHPNLAGGIENVTAYLVTSSGHEDLIRSHRDHGDVVGMASDDLCEDAARVIDLRHATER